MKPKISLQPAKCKGVFRFGNCASLAIGGAFDIDLRALTVIAKAIKLDLTQEGLTFGECQRLITYLCKEFKYTNFYTPNTTKVSYTQFLNILPKGKYILDVGEHLSYYEDMVVYDSYMEDPKDFQRVIPTGWWQIEERKRVSLKF
jgi:hypothetical protein